MSKVRLIARMDVKGPNVIKGVQLEGLRVVGNPNELARKYYQAGIDEIIYMDSVASLYGRNSLTDIVRSTVRNVFAPITVGGGIRSVDDARDILRSGADKVAVNTAAIKRPDLISEISRRFGAQCMVLSIEAKKQDDGTWEAYWDNGRERSGVDVVEWAKRGVALGAGEILLTSVDREGTRKGFDIPLITAVADSVSVPVIASGGMGKIDDMVEAVNHAGARAVAMADVLHFERLDIPSIREGAMAHDIGVRKVP